MRAAVHATAQLLLGESSESSLDQLHPRAAGWREVDGKSRNAGATNGIIGVLCVLALSTAKWKSRSFGTARSIITAKVPKLPRAVALIKLPDDFTARGIQGREDWGGAIPGVVGVRRSTCPARMGNDPGARSDATGGDFSSARSTSALSGGSKNFRTMSRLCR